MSVQAGSVVVAIKAVDEASSVFGKIQASLGVLGGTLNQLGGGFASVGNVISGLAAGGPMGALTAGIGELTKGLEWAVGEAKASEQSWKDLQAALGATGSTWDTIKAKVGDFASAIQKTTTFSDEMVIGAVQRMSTFGMSYTQGMDAVKVAIDLAAAKHMDLQSAADLVGKAFMGNTAILSKYGIDITTAKEATANTKTVFDQLKASMKTITEEQLVAFSEHLGNLREGFGDMGISSDSADKAVKTLIASFEAGKIPAEAFAGLAHNLGIDIDETKLKTGDFNSVLDQLTKQFGGQATAQAETYEGVQKRLANAMSDVGEKIGGMLLPVLANLTEGMIPVVDWLGQGVEQVQSWISAVSKMPEVKAATDAVGAAFSGLQKWFGDVSSTVMEELGPALSDLWDAFKEIGAALSPLIDAFGEIWAAFSDGQGSGNMLKDLLGLVAGSIKLIALGIKEAAPVIKSLAEAFKAAAEFITPTLVALRDTIGGFLGWLHDAFQGFYNFLVGHSLWQDMWNALGTVATNAITSLLGNIGSSLFTPLQTGFQSTVNSLKSIFGGVVPAITKPLEEIAGKIQEQFPAISKTISAGTDVLKGDWVAGIGKLAQATPGAFAEVTSSIQKTIGDVGGNIGKAMTDALGGVKSTSLGDFFAGLFGGAKTGAAQTIPPIDEVIKKFQEMSASNITAERDISSAFTNVLAGLKKQSETLTLVAEDSKTMAQNLINAFDKGGVSSKDFANLLSQLGMKFTGTAPHVDALANAIATFHASLGERAEVDPFIESLYQLQNQSATLNLNFANSAEMVRGLYSAFDEGKISLSIFTGLLDVLNTKTSDVTGMTYKQIADWSGKLREQFMELYSQVVGHSIWPDMWNAIQDITASGTIHIAATWQSTLSAMVSTTSNSFTAMVNIINSQVDAIINRLKSAQSEITTHSIWPDMLNMMVTQTRDAMGEIQGVFGQGLVGPSGIVPTMQASQPGMAMAGGVAPGQQSHVEITTPINVYLDGQLISTFVERRLVDTITRDASRSTRA